MIDDKDESAPDPWAGIDDDAAGQSADGFTFAFDAASEIGDPPGLLAAAEPVADEPAPAPFPADAVDDVPVFPLDVAVEIDADADPFASLAVDAADVDDGAAAADDVSAWLSDPAADAGGEPPQGSSHVEVGTGFSGIVTPSEVDPTSGVVPADEWPEVRAAEAAGDAEESMLDDFATDEQPAFDASGFDGVGDLDAGAASGSEQFQDEGLEAAGAAAVAATVAAPKARPPARKRGGGGIGQLIGIVLGGLMAIPITYAILIWGFQKDPFKLAGMLPEQVAGLLPEQLQPGFKNSGGSGPKPARPLDDLAALAVAEPPVEPVVGDDVASSPVDPAEPVADERPLSPDSPEKMPADDPVKDPVSRPVPAAEQVAAAPPRPVEPPAPPEPEPLDLTALEAAVGEASAAFDELALADPEAPDRRKLLVTWYRRLAAAAEQLVLLEKVAADSGRPLGDAAAALDPLATAIAADPTVQADLARLSRMWLGSKKRAADGAMLLATFDGARQVGPYWSMLITVDGAEPMQVNAISRSRPMAEPGARVLVAGVVFDGDVVWATDCRQLGGEPTPVEDLF